MSERVETCGLYKRLHMSWQISWLRRYLCGESAGDYKRVIFGRRLNPTGPWSRSESGPNKRQAFHTKRSIGASFSRSIRKNPDGWRILTRGRIHTGSNSSGNVAGHGLQCKPQRSLRVNGSARCIFTDLIRSMLCHGNGLITMRI